MDLRGWILHHRYNLFVFDCAMKWLCYIFFEFKLKVALQVEDEFLQQEQPACNDCRMILGRYIYFEFKLEVALHVEDGFLHHRHSIFSTI